MADRDPDVAEQLRGLLGELELPIMDIVWSRGTVTVREVHEALSPDRPLAYTTVMTVMARLTEKGVLERSKRGRAFEYASVTHSRRAFLRRAVRQQIQALIHRFGEVAVAEFVDEMSAGERADLADLEAHTAQHRRATDSRQPDDRDPNAGSGNST